MKLTTLIIIIAIVHVSAASYAQKVTYKNNSVTLVQMIKEIRQQTGYNVLVSANLIGNIKPKDVNFKDAPLEEVMDTFLADQPLTYVIEDKTILIQKKELTSSGHVDPVIGNSITVTAKVTDELGNPMSGVTVREINTSNGVITDAKGNFSISVKDEKSTISFSYIGYETQVLKAIDIINGSVIRLNASPNNLQEVVVDKGYYSTTNSLNTGDINSVSAKVISEQPVSNLLSAIEGRVPGLVVNQVTGLPGSAYTVQIQGKNSIANGNDPLYVVDGVPYNAQMAPNGIGGILGSGRNDGSNAAYGNPLSYLNPSDIEKIEVLKDADATAIYGSRGANGVILITTKKGKAGETKVNVNLNQGIGRVGHFMDLMNTQQYLQMRHEAFANDDVTPTVDNAPDLLLWDTTQNTNWQKILIGGTAQYTDAQGNVSGGTTNTQYFVGAGYHRETTVYPGDFSDQKGSLNFSLNTSSINQKFKFLISGQYLYDDNKLPSADVTSLLVNLPPDAPSSFNPNGTLNWAYYSSGVSTWPNTNPYSELLQPYHSTGDNIVLSSTLSYDFLPNLELSSKFGYTLQDIYETIDYPQSSLDPNNPYLESSSIANSSTIRSWLVQPQLNYNLDLGKGKLNALVGSEFNQTTTIGQGFAAFGFPNDEVINDLALSGNLSSASYTNTSYKYTAAFARIGFNWADKYIINATTRRDGSSRFGPDKQFHDFSSVGVAWLIGNEKFLKDNLSFLSHAKLSASYGTTGSDQIGNYLYQVNYRSTNTLSYNGNSGIIAGNLANPNLSWEETKKTEIGVDLGLLNERLSIVARYYRNETSDQLLGAPLPAFTGFTSIEENLPATVRNTGTEIEINSINIKTANFSWSTSFNITVPKNVLAAFPNLSMTSYKNFLVVGQSITQGKVFTFKGVNPTTGLYQFLDSQGGLTNSPNYSTDENSHEDLAPKYYGGLSNTFRYKSFDLSVFFQFTKQTGYSLFAFSYATPGTEGYNQLAAVTNSWQSAGNSKSYQVFSQNTSGAASNVYSYLASSTAGYTDASYIRLKNVSLSYTFPKDLSDKIHLHNLKVFLQGENLLTFTHNYWALDPETQSGATLPPLQVITAGFQITL